MHNAIINGKEPSSNGRDLLMHNLGELEPLGKDLELGSHSTLQVESVNLLKAAVVLKANKKTTLSLLLVSKMKLQSSGCGFTTMKPVAQLLQLLVIAL